jgi:hypothetical protein
LAVEIDRLEIRDVRDFARACELMLKLGQLTSRPDSNEADKPADAPKKI